MSITISSEFRGFVPNCLYILQNQYTKDDIKVLIEKDKMRWSTHYSIELDKEDKFIKEICKKFNVNIIYGRVNFFEKDMFKEFHKDFYKQDITIVLNIDPAEVVFKNDKTGISINILLGPLSIYIFDDIINDKWSHKVERVMDDRYSIILWCKKM